MNGSYRITEYELYNENNHLRSLHTNNRRETLMKWANFLLSGIRFEVLQHHFGYHQPWAIFGSSLTNGSRWNDRFALNIVVMIIINGRTIAVAIVYLGVIIVIVVGFGALGG